jgi:hypothetical protein
VVKLTVTTAIEMHKGKDAIKYGTICSRMAYRDIEYKQWVQMPVDFVL